GADGRAVRREAPGRAAAGRSYQGGGRRRSADGGRRTRLAARTRVSGDGAPDGGSSRTPWARPQQRVPEDRRRRKLRLGRISRSRSIALLHGDPAVPENQGDAERR